MNFTLLSTLLFLLLACIGKDTSTSRQTESDRPQRTSAKGEVAKKLPEKITVIYQSSDETYWFAGGNYGVCRLDGAELIRFDMTDGLCSNHVIGIQEDSFGNIFFDTGEGVSKFDGSEFRTLQIANADSSAHEWKLQSSDLWFRMGTHHDGPLRYDGNYLYPLAFPKTDRANEFHKNNPDASWNPYGIYTVYKDRSGALWFGTASLGVCRFDG